MGSHPINLLIRFLLEMGGLVALGRAGWVYGEGVYAYASAIAIPLVAAVLWGTFAVPDDPSRSGKAPVPVPGVIRLMLEAVFFLSATWSLVATGFGAYGWIYGLVVLIHYAASYDRLAWLIRQ